MKLRGILRIFAWIVLLLPVFAVCMLSQVSQPFDLQSGGITPPAPTAPGPTSRPAHRMQLDIPGLLTGIFNELPDQARVDEKDFAAVFSAEHAHQLAAAGVSSISRDGGHVELELRQPLQRRVSSKLEASVQTSVSFDVTPGVNSLEFHNITGIKLHVNWLLGWMDLTDLTMRRDSQGNTELHAQVKVWFLSGKTSYAVTLGPDGKPLPKK